jgi:integrase
LSTVCSPAAARTGLVIREDDGAVANRDKIVGRANRAWKAAKLHALRPDDCRHSYASLMIATRKVDPKMLEEFIGHSSIKITMDLYGHLWPDAREAAVAAMDDFLAATRERRARSAG